MNSMNKYFGRIFFALALLFFWINFFSPETEILGRVERYAKSSSPVSLGNLGARINQSRGVVLSMAFTLRPIKGSQKNGNTYQNLFQTAPGNSGVRLEVCYDDHAPVSWAIVVGDDHGHVTVADLGPVPEVGQRHALMITIDKNSVVATLDGRGISVTREQIPTFLGTDVLVGMGFSTERVFYGEVENFTISNKTRFGVLTENFPASLVVALSLVLLWLAYIPRTKRINGEYRVFATNFQAARYIALLAIYMATYSQAKSYYVTLTFQDVLLDLIQIVFAVWFTTYLFWKIRARAFRVVYLITVGFANAVFFMVFIAGAVFLDKTKTTLVGAYTGEMGALYQTSWREVLEFFWVYYDCAEFSIICAASIMQASIFLTLVKSRLVAEKSRRLTAVAVCVTIAAILTHSVSDSITSQLLDGYGVYAANVLEFRNLMEKRAAVKDLSARVGGKGLVYIVVVGESSNKNHYSAYGYYRNTTPYLKQKSENKNWLFFSRAYASYVHTTPSIMHAFTEANQYNGRSYYSSASLIEVFNAAGFDSYWLDEQGRAVGDNPVNVLAAYSKVNRIVPPGGALVDEFKSVLRNIDRTKNNLIVLHLMGSHFDYKTRLPKGYAYHFNDDREELGDFSKDLEFVREVLDPYDATIQYTDKLIENLKRGCKRIFGGSGCFCVLF